ncbi:MAG: PTS sugar transporter subunit IIA [Elusimicrobiota bacterium]|jgi:PTS system fructose-specific IIA component|nr:PTS sugar transporter subunit IIA [Elusimicrobiota bacterium]
MEVLIDSNIKVGVKASNREEIFGIIADTAIASGYANNKYGILDGLKAREKQGSTGTESGFAIPHAIGDAIDYAAIVILKLEEPIPFKKWKTLDGKPVDYVISLLAPQGAGSSHLRILSTLSALLVDDDFQVQLKAKATPIEIYKFLRAELAKKAKS